MGRLRFRDADGNPQDFDGVDDVLLENVHGITLYGGSHVLVKRCSSVLMRDCASVSLDQTEIVPESAQ